MKNKQKKLKIKEKNKALKPKELKPKESIEYDNYFINALAEIRKSTKPIDPDEDLTYIFKGNSAPISFNDFKGPMHIFKSIYDGDRILEDIEEEQIKLSSDLGHVNQRPPKYKTFEQLDIIEKVRGLYNSREKVMQMFNNYSKNISRNIDESKHGKGLKILTPKQMLQRLPIAVAQIKIHLKLKLNIILNF